VTISAANSQPDRLVETRCAICGTVGNASELYPATLGSDAFTPTIFSARRLPDRIHHRMVTCNRCRLVRADPVLDGKDSELLYQESTFDYGEELEGLRVTYGETLDRLVHYVPKRDGLVDIGCGNGFVLEVAQERGWSNVRGVEPSADAIAHAAPTVRDSIVADIMRPGILDKEAFDAVTLFQVLDHMPDPLELLTQVRATLRPGGVVMAFNHNVTAWSARLLGERSPIIDVEHTYLYDPQTSRALFTRAGFDVIEVGSVRNTYSLAYLLHLVPIPRATKEAILRRVQGNRLARRQVTVPLGNLRLIARRSV
jgi:SAM-dependent methyltransferase